MKRIVWTLVAALLAALVPTPADALLTFTVGTKLTDGRPDCGGGAPPGYQPADDGSLKVATFNLLHSETDDGDISLGPRLPLIADAIIASGADIVGAQEVTANFDYDEKNEHPQKHGDVATRLAAVLRQKTGEQWWWCFSRSNPHVPLTPDLATGGGNPLDDLAAEMGNFPDDGSFAEGVAIFSRYPMVSARFRRMLPRSYEAPACVGADPFCPLAATFDGRQVLYARVLTPRGGVDMFTTHLAHGLTTLSDTTKRLQMRQTLAVAKQWSAPDPVPDFIVGDFNSGPYSKALRFAREMDWYDTYRAAGAPECNLAGLVACSGGPKDGEEVFTKDATRSMRRRIDYVLAKAPRGCSLRVSGSERIGDTPARLLDGRYLWPSDHYGFVSTVSCTS